MKRESGLSCAVPCTNWGQAQESNQSNPLGEGERYSTDKLS